MCSNYRAVTEVERLAKYFGIAPDDVPPAPEFPKDTWPTTPAPFIRLSAEGKRIVEAGHFGLLPHFAKEVTYGRKTYNSRSETVATLPSFKTAWKRGQRCIVPVEKIYEPCYEIGKPIRWAIESATATPMGIAGIWTEHPFLKMPDGSPALSFAMLTVNADGHPVFQRMHAPDDEKRMVVILDTDQYDDWLTCRVEDATTFFRQYLGELNAYAAPLPPRTPKPKRPKGQPDPKDAPLL
jgi:putative SOS response-associated peptidase YedK